MVAHIFTQPPIIKKASYNPAKITLILPELLFYSLALQGRKDNLDWIKEYFVWESVEKVNQFLKIVRNTLLKYLFRKGLFFRAILSILVS